MSSLIYTVKEVDWDAGVVLVKVMSQSSFEEISMVLGSKEGRLSVCVGESLSESIQFYDLPCERVILLFNDDDEIEDEDE